MTSLTGTGRARAWAWIAHLRGGGTTPWGAWTSASVPGAAEDGGRFLPGAQQLELLRRVNLAGRPSEPLVERVLTASAPGRGRPDLELVGVDETRQFGPPAVDPADLPDEELLRVATGLLAEDVVAVGRPAHTPERRPRRLRTRYELVGDPWVAPALTAQLVADGRPPGGRGRAVHVLGADLATMLGHAWTASCLGDGAPSWPDFLAKARARRRLPHRLDLVTIAERFLARPHTGRVDVVLDPALLPALVGVRRLDPTPDLAVPAADLARQVGVALSLLVTPPVQTRLLHAVVLPRLAPLPGNRPEVPAEHRDWVEDAATGLRRRLLRTGYPVMGDPDRLLPRWPAAGSPDRATQHGTVLDLAIGLLLEPLT